MNRSKKFISLLLSLLLLLAVSPISAIAADNEVAWYTSFGMHSGSGTLAQAVASVTPGGEIRLLGNYTSLNETLTIDKNVTITSSGGSYSVIRGTSFTGAMFNIASNVAVNFENITLDGNLSGVTAVAPVIVATYGTITLGQDAAIIDNYAPSADGGAIALGDPTGTHAAALTIAQGATISGCTARDGGAIYVCGNATVALNGGEIKDCAALRNGGAIALEGGRLNMASGSLTGSTAANRGSAISVSATSSAYFTSGTVSQNTSNASLGAIYIAPGATVSVGNDIFIFDNNGASGQSNIYVADGAGITVSPAFVMGAKIGISTEADYTSNPNIDFITYTGDITGFIYEDGHGLTYYVSDGHVTLLECITVTFDPGNGTCSTAAKIYPVDLDFGWLPYPDERDGFAFDGWYTASDSLVTEESPVYYSEDITLYAKWTNLNALDSNPLAVIGRFFEEIGRLMRIVFDFLSNLFNGNVNAGV